jgi:hypothetical protein
LFLRDQLGAERLRGDAHAIEDRLHVTSLGFRQRESRRELQHVRRAGVAVQLGGFGHPHPLALAQRGDVVVRQRLDAAVLLPGIGRRC